MIPNNLMEYSKSDLIYWLRHESGSSNPDYFKAVKAGGLKLQQVPEEYAELLLLLKSKKIKSYLELGIGNGGSFAVACSMMQETLNNAIAVDNLAYRGLGIGQNEKEISEFVNMGNLKAVRTFRNMSTDAYFKALHKEILFDAIFIDADHSYQGAKKDFDNALNHIKTGGIIIFHDIASVACPGIVRLWKEAKENRKYHEFIFSNTCGIGVIEL